MLKSGEDRLLDAALVALGWFVLGAVLIAVFGLPAAAAWPYVLATALIHALYWAALTRGYDAGDLSHVYTLSRGLAPLLVSIAAIFAAREIPRPSAAVGIGLVSLGVLFVGASRRAPLRATGWALVIGCTIGAYSLVDALGARVAGNAACYAGWMLFASSLPIAVFAILRRGGRRLYAAARTHWQRGLGAGVVSGVGYAVVLFAQTLAPVGQVTALRETSVVFAAVIARVFLREHLGVRRVVGALVVAIGAGLIALT